MHIKRRGSRAMLYRSHWIAKGAQGNTHGFSSQRFVGSLSLDAQALPEELAARLTPTELAFVEERVFQPARQAAEREQRLLTARARDPLWRVDEAIRLLKEACALATERHIPPGRVKELREVVAALPGVSQSDEPKRSARDPLSVAVTALQVAAEAVAEGQYGSPVPGTSRKSSVYQHWQSVTRHVEGGGSGVSLLKALQARGWVKTRGS